MTLYIRGYPDHSYEIIYLEGVFRKSRVHILINPGERVKLPGQADKGEIELNIESLTHIVCMDTSVPNKKLIDRTIYLAERTNKPIITNQETSSIFRDHGLSVKQLRILGFEEEIVEGIQIDPVYVEELSDEIQPVKEQSTFSVGGMLKAANPLNWKPIKKISQTILPIESKKEEKIDHSKPLGFIITLGSKLTILLPLDKRGVSNLNRILPQYDIHTLVIPNHNISFIRKIDGQLSNLILLSNDLPDDETIIVPKSHNTDVRFDTIVGGIEEWIEIK